MSEDASAGEKLILAQIKRIITNIRRDEQEGIVFPLAYDEGGNKLYDLALLSSGGKREFDTSEIIERYDRRIAQTCLADFILLGHEKVGSFALASSKTDIFAMAIGAWLDSIAGVFNRYAVPRLFEINGIRPSGYPRLVPSDIETPELSEVADYIAALASAGAALFPDMELENHLRRIGGLPERKGGPSNMNPADMIRPERLSQAPDAEIRQSFHRLNQLYGAARGRGEAVETYVNAAIFVIREMERRGFHVSEGLPLVRAARALSRKLAVRGEAGDVPEAVKPVLSGLPEEIVLIRDFVSLVGSAAVTEEPADLDVLIRAGYDVSRGSYAFRGSVNVALRRFLDPRQEPGLHFIDSPQGRSPTIYPIRSGVSQARAATSRIEPEPASTNGSGASKDAWPRPSGSASRSPR